MKHGFMAIKWIWKRLMITSNSPLSLTLFVTWDSNNLFWIWFFRVYPLYLSRYQVRGPDLVLHLCLMCRMPLTPYPTWAWWRDVETSKVCQWRVEYLSSIFCIWPLVVWGGIRALDASGVRLFGGFFSSYKHEWSAYSHGLDLSWHWTLGSSIWEFCYCMLGRLLNIIIILFRDPNNAYHLGRLPSMLWLGE